MFRFYLEEAVSKLKLGAGTQLWKPVPTKDELGYVSCSIIIVKPIRAWPGNEISN